MSLIRGNALTLPLADESVDLIVTSPPYFALRSYTDACGTCGGRVAERLDTNGMGKSTLVGGGTKKNPKPERFQERVDENAVEPDPDCPECSGSGRGHYAGQIGSEATPAEFIDALIEVTRECVRVLKPSGSIWVNLGDKYCNPSGSWTSASSSIVPDRHKLSGGTRRTADRDSGIRPKSLMGLPWRYALRCTDDLGLILRAEIIWSKPNGLPESVTDRVRRSHEQWFHMVKEPRYFSAVDEIREAQMFTGGEGSPHQGRKSGNGVTHREYSSNKADYNPLGKLPGSVWSVPTEPLRVPDHLPQHFAAFPSEFPRRIVLGWSPSGICVSCGEGRRPVVEKELVGVWHDKPPQDSRYTDVPQSVRGNGLVGKETFGSTSATITGESCACPTPDAPTRPAVVLDPFAGTGTTVAVASALGRHGIGVDLSADYLRLARWRCSDPGLRAKALGVDKPKPEVPGQLDLLESA